MGPSIDMRGRMGTVAVAIIIAIRWREDVEGDSRNDDSVVVSEAGRRRERVSCETRSLKFSHAELAPQGSVTRIRWNSSETISAMYTITADADKHTHSPAYSDSSMQRLCIVFLTRYENTSKYENAHTLSTRTLNLFMKHNVSVMLPSSTFLSSQQRTSRNMICRCSCLSGRMCISL
jgi:hypothetical protein